MGRGVAWFSAFDVVLIVCKSFWYVFQVAEHKYEDFQSNLGVYVCAGRNLGPIPSGNS